MARAVERGFVTPDKTLLIASTHRVFAMTEKIALADGRAMPRPCWRPAATPRARLVAFDMEALADATGSALSAVLFGALAGSGALPFPRTAFEAAIRRGQVGVNSSLAAFARRFEAARIRAQRPLLARGDAAARELAAEADTDHSSAGVERLHDYQDAGYAATFWRGWSVAGDRAAARRRLRPAAGGDRTPARAGDGLRGHGPRGRAQDPRRAASRACATKRRSRTDRSSRSPNSFIPARRRSPTPCRPALDAGSCARAGPARLLDRATRKGNIIKTTSVGGFLLLYALAQLKPLRRRSLRFAAEQAALDGWLDLLADTAARDYALALQVARMRSLVKGYGDTHERGRAKFDRLAALVPACAGRTIPAHGSKA